MYLLPRSLVAVASLSLVAGHGHLSYPPSLNQSGALWFNQGCMIGCSKCEGWDKSSLPCATMTPTITDPALITYESAQWSKNPWRAPGFAPVLSPCGLASGWYEEHQQGGGIAPVGFEAGFDGRDVPTLSGSVMKWPTGSVQEVSWFIDANHGGGYAYRLCPKSTSMSEECFQRHHLAFAGESSWIQFGTDKSNRTQIRANRTSHGTFPHGSQWTKVPIPSCSGQGGGYDGSGCDKPQFPSPVPGLWGNGPFNGCAHNPMPAAERAEYCARVMDFHIVDLVQIPTDLPLGDYVLSFRWDCEQTPQIWTNCADIEITESGTNRARREGMFKRSVDRKKALRGGLLGPF
jgi:hypothetical protein